MTNQITDEGYFTEKQTEWLLGLRKELMAEIQKESEKNKEYIDKLLGIVTKDGVDNEEKIKSLTETLTLMAKEIKNLNQDTESLAGMCGKLEVKLKRVTD